MLMVLLSFGVGALVTVQGKLNGELKVAIGDGVVAAAIGFAAGLVLMALIVLPTRAGRHGIALLRPALGSGRLKWWHLVGGVCGALIVSSQAATVPVLGVGLFTVGVIAGQLGTSLQVDALGIGPAGRQRINALRVAAAALALLGVVVTVSQRVSGGNQASIVLVMLGFVMLAGAASAFQQAINGQVSVNADSSAVAGLLNFVVGLATLVVVLALRSVLQGDFSLGGTLAAIPWDRPYLLLTGPMGAAYIVIAAMAASSLGILLFSLVSLAGQLVFAVAIDLLVPTSGVDITWHLFVGTAMTLVAVGLGARARVPAQRG